MKRLARILPFLREHWSDLVFLTVFVASRMIYRGKYGIRFDGSPLNYFIQYIDPWFFENDFLRSILYVSHQAPIPNFVVGCAYLALGKYGWWVFFEGVFAGFGILFGLFLIRALKRFEVHPLFATILVCLFLSTPVAILYENWLFYHVPVAAIFCGSILALSRYYRTGSVRAAFVFFSSLALVALIRNVYGTVWLAAVVAVLLVAPPLTAPPRSSPRRTILKGAAFPLILLVALGMKGRLLLGHDYGGAAVWTNIVYKTWPSVPVAERERLQDEGMFKQTVNYEPFTGVSSLGSMRVPIEPTGVPLLDMARTPNGRANTHTLEYLLIAEKHYKPDGEFLVKNYPWAYVDSVLFALLDWYPSSPSRDIVLEQTVNYHRVKKLDVALNKLAGKNSQGRLLFLAIGLPAALLYGCYRVLRTRARLPSERTTVAAILFMLVTIAYAAFGTTLISSGDFSRYRFDVDPFYLILGAMLATHAARSLTSLFRRLRRRASPAHQAA